MSLIRLIGATRYYGADLIVGPTTLQIHPQARIGLIGPNGSGKSSLLKMLAGAAPDEGSVVVAKGARIELLRQEIPFGFAGTLFDFARSSLAHLDALEERLRTLETQMGDPAVQSDADRLADVMSTYSLEMARFEQAGGYERDARVRGALFGLGFSADQLDQPFDTLSGGQRSRAELARVLLTGADLMLLDEPTNHLDLESTEWLQSFLQRGSGGYVVVSHDRVLLDQVTEETWEIEDAAVIAYPGNYTASRQQASMRRERMAKVFEEDQREREKLEAYIRKYKAGNRATQAKSREKRLARMEEAPPPPTEPRKARFSVPSGPRSEKRVCTFENVTLGYGAHEIFRGLTLEIERGNRIGIAGPNGSGKSTILKAISEELEPIQGVVDIGRGVSLRYFSQHRDDLDPQKTVLDEALDEKRQQVGEARSFLARFLFRGDDVYKQVSMLSGGEKSRLALAKLLLHGGNLLLLDEPTNHLDIGMREALEEALSGYDGTLLFVTHDRSLLERMARTVWWVEDGQVTSFTDGYAALVAWLAERREAAGKATESAATRRTDERGGSAPKARDAARKRESEAKKALERIASIEQEIELLAEKKLEIEEALADPSTYEDQGRVEGLSKEHAEITAKLERLETEWSELAEAVE